MSDWPEPPREIVVDDATVLRPVFETPAEEMYALIDSNRARLGKYLEFATPQYSINDARQYADDCRAKWGRHGEQSYSIFHSGKLAGTIGMLRYGSSNRAIEIGYWLGREFEGKGIMSRCLEKILETVFDRLDANQANISAAVSNARSRAVAERAGFKSDGITRRWLLDGQGGLADMARYSMLKEEWRARRNDD